MPIVKSSISILFASIVILASIYFIYDHINSENNIENNIENNFNADKIETNISRNTNPLPDQRADLFNFSPTKYLRLNGNELPRGLHSLSGLRVQITPGEYEPFAFIISSNEKLENVVIEWNDLKNGSNKLSRKVIDPYICKIWYQAGIKNIDINNKLLTQELLLKNDALIKVDEKLETNFLQVQNMEGEFEYIDISSPEAVFPEGVLVIDSPELLPFTIDQGKHRLIWFIIHIPNNQPSGKYSGNMILRDTKGIISEIPIEIEVLPFKLEPSFLLYGIYYHGYYDNVSKRSFHFTNKNDKLYRAEMKDIKEHGILYPTTYQVLGNLHNDLRIRNEIGFPQDKLFTIGLKTGNPRSSVELNTLVKNIEKWQNKINEYGYDTLFIYGIDEAKGELLKSQRPAWDLVHNIKARVFVAGYYDTFYDMGDLLDIAVIQGPLNPDQAKLYHSKGQRILSYSNPQAGEENPEVYRRNFGLALWKAGYDGAMEYAYQKNYNSTWNDFDHHKYREENFTYPTSNGIISTIQWEGFREAIDDVKYLSTLMTRIKYIKSKNNDTTVLENWIANLQPAGDLDKIRSEMIRLILSTF